MAGVKKTSKFVTEAALRKETARLGKGVDQTLKLLKGISAEVKSTAKGMAIVVDLQKQLDEIRALQRQMIDAAKAPKPAKKRRKLTEMNIFVSEQLKSGKSFSEAIQAWKAFKASKAAMSVESTETT